MDNSNFYSGLVDIEVMDDVSNIRKHDLSGKQVVPCDALSLQGDICEANAGKGNTNPIRGGPKKNGVNIKSESPTLQSPPIAGSDVVIAKKPTSMAKNSGSIELTRPKKGTWKRASIKSRPSLNLPLNNMLGAKRSGKEFSQEAEKADLTKRKQRSVTIKFSMFFLGRIRVHRRRLLCNPTGHYESIELELPWAWEPADNSCLSQGNQ